MDPSSLQHLFAQTAEAIREALSKSNDWSKADGHPGQHIGDVVANEAALSLLQDAGLPVLSEESGFTEGSPGSPDAVCTIVIDPVDGSTNASKAIPWYSMSICAVDAAVPLVARVENLVTGQSFTAQRGSGAHFEGSTIAPSDVKQLSKAVLGLSGHPKQHWGWKQYRSLGSSALDICLVAKGSLDGFVDCSAQDSVASKGHGPWDYMAAMLICQEAGASVAEAKGRDLVVLDHAARRYPVAAATPELLEELLRKIN